MSLTLVTAPAAEPIDLAEAKLHLRVDHTDDDTLIDGLIVAARQYAEMVTRRALVTQTWDWKMDAYPASPFLVPLPPLQSVTSITYTDTNGSAQSWATTEYDVDAPAGDFADFGRIALGYGVSYPSTRGELNAVTIRFVAGYGLAAAVPQQIKQAMYLLIGHLYENRETVIVTGRGELIGQMPMGTDFLLWPFRALRF